MDGGEGGRQQCDGLTSGDREASPGEKWRLIRGGGLTSRISNGLQTQDPGGGEVQLTSYPVETVALPVLRSAGSRPTHQSVGLHSGAVQVSAVSVDVTRRRVDRPVSTIPDSSDVDVTG